MTKTCYRCKETKTIDEFFTSRSNTWCRACKKSYDNADYANTKSRRKKNILARKARNQQETKQFIYEFCKSHPCTDCGEADPIVLEFDHLGDKSYNVSSMVDHSMKMIQKEIAKCEVVCANCHRRRTAKRASSFRHVKESISHP